MKSAAGSRTRSELKKLKRKFKKGTLLADTSKVSGATISRVLSGKSRPSPRTLRKLVDLLDTEAATRLVAAYLMDQVPSRVRKELCISLRQKDPQGQRYQCWDPFVQKILSLDSNLVPHLESLVDALLIRQGDTGVESQDSGPAAKSPPAAN